MTEDNSKEIPLLNKLNHDKHHVLFQKEDIGSYIARVYYWNHRKTR